MKAIVTVQAHVSRYFWRYLAVLAASFLLGGSIATHGLFSSEVASWTQAIGAITAVWAAFAVGQAQMRAASDLYARKVRSIEDAVRATACQGLGMVDGLCQLIIEGVIEKEGRVGAETLRSGGAKVATFLETYSGLPLHEVEDAALQSAYRFLIFKIQSAATLIEQTSKIIEQNQEVPDPVKDMWKELSSEFNDLTSAFVDVPSDDATPSNLT